MNNLGLRGRRTLDLRWRGFDLLLLRLRPLSHWLGRSGAYYLGLRGGCTLHLLRRGLPSGCLGSGSVDNPRLRGRRMLDLWRRRFNFLLRYRRLLSRRLTGRGRGSPRFRSRVRLDL